MNAAWHNQYRVVNMQCNKCAHQVLDYLSYANILSEVYQSCCILAARDGCIYVGLHSITYLQPLHMQGH